MAKSTRVHILAKELGVKSKAIVDKCQAEGLDVKNHMATISAGLAATIREWFSEGEHSTTVETSKPVDLEKVRVRKKKKIAEKPAAEEAETADTEMTPEIAAETETADSAFVAAEVETAGAEITEPVEAAEPEAEVQADVKGKSIEVSPEEGKTAAAAKKTEKKKGTKDTDTKEVKAEPVKGPVFVEPPEPEEIVPAGPMLDKPKPAKLTGPRVVRVESVEPHEARPHRGSRQGGGKPSRSRYDKPISEPLLPADVKILDSTGTGKKGRDKTRGRRKDTSILDQDPKQKSPRRMRARDIEDRRARLAAARGETLRARPSRRIESKRAGDASHVERPEKATVSEPITVKSLSAALATKVSEIVGKLMEQGIMATANQVIAADMAEMISVELGTELTIERKQIMQDVIEQEFAKRERTKTTKRPPVVTMLGHVDHGKTSLLDKIRSTSVAAGEAGGITQHIGAHQVDFKGKRVTFLDTPGHEAFTAMRARGANMTDIVVLVVAADDGLMPQTIEAIHHARAAGVEMIVALNKIDIPGVDINRIYGQLAEHELTPSEWGGTTEVVKTSAITGEGIEDLIEYLDYIAELKDFKADSSIPATGWVIEAKMTSTQGAVATILIKEGQINKSDIVLAGTCYGRVRTLKNSFGKSIKKATSSMAVEISGLNDVPQAGDKFFCLKDINRAKLTAEENKACSREKSLAQRTQITLDNLFSQIEAGNIKELNLVLKADVQGSVDVLMKYLSELSTDEVQIRILHAAVGGISEGDVVLAEASGAIIIGFNVVADERVREIAESSGVDIRLYNIIYRITEDLRDAMEGMLEPEFKEQQLGTLVVRNTFKVSSIGTIAGCYVNSGVVTKKSFVRLSRAGIVIKDKCTIDSLKHFKDDAREVKSGLECGIKLAGYDDIKIDDELEAYEIVEVARTL